MKSVIVLGYGQMGSVVAADLSSRGYKVSVLDTLFEPTDTSFSGDKITIDVCNTNALKTELLRGGYNLAICCLPAPLGYNTVEACIEAELNCVDMSFTNEDMSGLHYAAVRNKVLVIYDVGFAPGIPNMIIGDTLRERERWCHYPPMDIRVYAGGVALNSAINHLGYVVTWQVEDMLSEFIRPARYKVNSSVKTADPLKSSLDLVQVGPFIFESFISDGLRSLLDEHVPNIVERTLRWPGHTEKMRKLFETYQFIGNRKLVQRIKENCSEGEDLVVMRVDIDRQTYEMIVYPKDGLTAMARCTAGTCAAVAETVLVSTFGSSLYSIAGPKCGVFPLEKVDIWQQVDKRLEEREIYITGRRNMI